MDISSPSSESSLQSLCPQSAASSSNISLTSSFSSLSEPFSPGESIKPSRSPVHRLDVVRAYAQSVLQREAAALLSAAERLSQESNPSEPKSSLDVAFDQALDAILGLAATNGRLILAGIGKSGLLAKKAAATFCSLGTPALFLDPVSALHGDLGILSPNRTDVVILISYSGNTVELLHLAATLRTRCRTLVALTKCAQSPLSVASNIWLDASIGGDGLEADPGLPAPTSSLVVALGLLDALALAALRSNVGFEQEEEKQAQQSAASSQQAREVFVWNHPGGSLGLQLAK